MTEQKKGAGVADEITDSLSQDIEQTLGIKSLVHSVQLVLLNTGTDDLALETYAALQDAVDAGLKSCGGVVPMPIFNHLSLMDLLIYIDAINNTAGQLVNNSLNYVTSRMMSVIGE